MAYEPLTEEQYNKAIDSGLSHEQIIQFEQQRKQSEDSIDSSVNEKPTMNSMSQALLNNLITAAKGTGEAALKTANEATFGAVGGIAKAVTGKDLPQESMDEATKQMASGAALVAPLPLGMVAEGATKMVAPIVKKFIKYDSALQQAQKGKDALDALRNTLGTAKNIAVKDVENVATDFSFNGVKSDKIMQAIKNPVYEVAFDKEGKVIQTVGNLDKVKSAIGELVNTPALWEEAPKTEVQHIKSIYGQVNQAMKEAARGVGKPIDAQLEAYNKFMDKYAIVNKTLVDNAGNAMGNKLKTAFKIQAEPAVKQAWKDLSKSSPQIKSVMDSMNKRELIKNLIKYGGTGAVTFEGGKKVITGHF